MTERAKRSVERVLQAFRAGFRRCWRWTAAAQCGRTYDQRQSETGRLPRELRACPATGTAVVVGGVCPPLGHPQRRETIVELVRVDMEYSWAKGQGNRVEDYQMLFPEDLRGGECLQQVAFEEYRLRRLAGECVARREYVERLAIPTDSWVEVPVGVGGQDSSTFRLDESSISLLSQVHPELAHRLADAARQMPSVGDQFEHFELIGEFGRGAFGCVFLARQNDLARRFVALKITSPSHRRAKAVGSIAAYPYRSHLLRSSAGIAAGDLHAVPRTHDAGRCGAQL